ncbi:hypothetical protein SNEBB_011063 [Seison nebaliae]|nr:hypothetical protein SNEBB_011063 [Seison nebaliae]
MKYPIQIIYATQTGNCQEIATEIYQQYFRLTKVSPEIFSIDEFDDNFWLNENHGRRIIFIVSTTGDGEMPYQCRRFWKRLLMRHLPTNLFQEVSLQIIGLGDSKYEKYNFAAKRFFRRFIQLGAQMISDGKYLDDSSKLSNRQQIDNWLPQFFSILLDSNLEETNRHNLSIQFPTIKFDDDKLRELLKKKMNFFGENIFRCRVMSNKRISSIDHWQNVKILKLKFENNSNYSFNYGDCCGIVGENCERNIEKFKRIFLRFENERYFGEILNIYDLNCIPKQNFFQLFSSIVFHKIAKNERELERLIELGGMSMENVEDYYSYCTRCRRTIVEIFEEFPHSTSTLDLNELTSLLSIIRPRFYSICHFDKNSIELLYSVVEYKTNLTESRYGFCSNYMNELKLNDELSVGLMNGSFHLVENQFPKILLATGTGIAPFVQFINETTEQSIHLYFGCRNRGKDDGIINKLTNKCNINIAYSRDTEKKIYVQHLLKADREKIVDLLVRRNATIFIAGNSTNLSKSIKELINELIEEDDEKENYVQRLIREKRLQIECYD